MSIKRYRILKNAIIVDDSGNWVRYEDAIRRVSELESMTQKIMARLADLLEADHFNNIEAIVLDAGVPYPPLKR